MTEGLSPQEALQAKEFAVSVLLTQIEFGRDTHLTASVLPSENLFPSAPDAHGTITVDTLAKMYAVHCTKHFVKDGTPTTTGWDITVDKSGKLGEALFRDSTTEAPEEESSTRDDERIRELYTGSNGGDGELIIALRRLREQSFNKQANRQAKRRWFFNG